MNKAFISVFCCFALSQISFAQQVNSAFKLILTPESDTITSADPTFRFKLSYINGSDNPIFFVPRNSFIKLNNDYTALSIFKGGERKYLNPHLHLCFRPRHRNEYQKINPGDSFTKWYVVYFPLLMDSTGTIPAEYGTYTIFADYADYYRYRRKSLKQLTSNTLEVVYKK